MDNFSSPPRDRCRSSDDAAQYMKSITAIENPYASPQFSGTDESEDRLLRAVTRMYHVIGWGGLVFCLFAWFTKTVAQMAMHVETFDPGTLAIGLWGLFFVYVLWTARCLKKSFGKVYRRARWLAVLSAAIFFPLLTLPGILAVRRLERYRRFVGRGEHTRP